VEVAHVEYLRTLVDLLGQAVVDVGAGDGAFSRQLAEEGATVTAVEVDSDKVAKARASLPVEVEVVLGRAEDLPLKSQSQDLACLFFSLHHIPENAQDAAFAEVLRVLKPGGRLHVVEPYPYGTMFDVVRMVEDETRVRTHSHEILSRLGEAGEFRLLARQEYVLTREYPRFDVFVEKIVQPDADRRRIFSTVATDMEATYNRVVDEVNGARVLHQPCAAYHFQVRE
jgi:SAM-dependent methyltransferase